MEALDGLNSARARATSVRTAAVAAVRATTAVEIPATVVAAKRGQILPSGAKLTVRPQRRESPTLNLLPGFARWALG